MVPQPDPHNPGPAKAAAQFTATVKQVFPRTGSKRTPVHPSPDFEWKDYAPAVFRCNAGTDSVVTAMVSPQRVHHSDVLHSCGTEPEGPRV